MISNRLIVFVVFLNSTLVAQNFVPREEQTISLYKKQWNKEELFAPADTTIETIVFNSYFNVNQWTFNTKKVGESFKRKYSYTKDSIYLTVTSKKNILMHIRVFDSLNTIKEEGDLQGVGPFIIDQQISTKNSVISFKYTVYYYLIKIGNWTMYDEKSKMHYMVNSKIPNKLNIDTYIKENFEAVKKRRNKYLKKYKFDKDYYE